MGAFEKMLKYGNVGEQIVFQRLVSFDKLIYKNTDNKAHLIDAFVMDENKKIKGCEVKTIQRFGGVTQGLQTFQFLTRHWLEYREFCFDSGLELNIYIIDTITNSLYFAKFQDVDKIMNITFRGEKYVFPLNHIPPSNKECLLFPVDWFQLFGKLTESEIKLLK